MVLFGNRSAQVDEFVQICRRCAHCLTQLRAIYLRAIGRKQLALHDVEFGESARFTGGNAVAGCDAHDFAGNEGADGVFEMMNAAGE